MRIHFPAAGLAAALLSLSLIAPQLSAHEGATGVVKERMDAMKAMGDNMKRMGAMVKGKQAFEIQAFVEGAAVVSEHSPHIPMLFPEGSGSGKSEALPKLWQQWDRFEKLAVDTSKEADKLGELAASGADEKALKRQFVMLGKSCKSCHTDYRKKKKK